MGDGRGRRVGRSDGQCSQELLFFFTVLLPLFWRGIFPTGTTPNISSEDCSVSDTNWM